MGYFSIFILFSTCIAIQSSTSFAASLNMSEKGRNSESSYKKIYKKFEEYDTNLGHFLKTFTNIENSLIDSVLGLNLDSEDIIHRLKKVSYRAVKDAILVVLKHYYELARNESVDSTDVLISNTLHEIEAVIISAANDIDRITQAKVEIPVKPVKT